MFLSVVFLVVETPRYRTPIDPFLVLLAAAAVVTGARLRARCGAGAGVGWCVKGEAWELSGAP